MPKVTTSTFDCPKCGQETASVIWRDRVSVFNGFEHYHMVYCTNCHHAYDNHFIEDRHTGQVTMLLTNQGA